MQYAIEDSIGIPPGCRRVSSAEIDRDPELEEHTRWFGDNIRVVFDPEDPDYQDFLAKCKEATKAFNKELKKVCRKMGIPVEIVTRGGKKGRSPEGLTRMSFLIRPPHLKSDLSAEEKARRRMQWGDTHKFVIHIAPDGTLCQIRFSTPSKERGLDACIEGFNLRLAMVGHIRSQKISFKEYYPRKQWEFLAKDIAFAIKGALEDQD